MERHLIDGKLTQSVIGAFYDVYNTLGFGFLEHIYIMALERELLARGHRVAREVCVCVRYKGEELAQQGIDMMVDDRLIVEAKSTYDLHKAAPRQVFNYLRATNIEIAVLLHFGPQAEFLSRDLEQQTIRLICLIRLIRFTLRHRYSCCAYPPAASYDKV